MTNIQAFQMGYKDARRLRSEGLGRGISAHEAFEIHPHTLSDDNIGSYLNGWDDGQRGDTFRMDEIKRRGLR